MKLYAPKEYWSTPVEEIDSMTGGCGPGGFGDFLVPDTLWGLSVKLACRIHDFMYAIGETQEDKDLADEVFRNNMFRIVQANTKNRFLLRLRMRRALTYYKFVHEYGDLAYWSNKNQDDEFKDIELLQTREI